MTTRRNFLKAGASIGAGSLIPKAFAGGVHTGMKDGRPNILLIFTDQQTIDCMKVAIIKLYNPLAGRSISGRGSSGR